MRKSSYRTYATEANALRYARKLKAQYPHKFFKVILAPNGSFRYAVGLVLTEENRLALCA